MSKGFVKAQRKRKPVKMLLTGPSHSGKTLSALYLAHGMGGKVAVIDSEHGGSTFYHGRDGLDFDIWELEDFSDEAYLEAIKAGVDSRYDVLVIDSLTHEWEWMKDYVDKLQGRFKNQFQAWSVASPRQQKFIEYILAAPVHIICTARSKTEWVIEESDGKKTVKKVGTTPQLRQGTEFEFDIILDLDLTHTAHVDKDRTGLLDGKIFVPTPEWGKLIAEWISSGDGTFDVPTQPLPAVADQGAVQGAVQYVDPAKVTQAIEAFLALGMTEEQVRAKLSETLGRELDIESVGKDEFKKIRELYRALAKGE